MKTGAPRLTIQDLSEELLAPDLEGYAKDFFYLVRLSEDRARDFFEQARWPRGPICPACKGKDIRRSTLPPPWKGHYDCDKCDARFMVTTGTPMEGSPLPLRKWLLGTYLLCCVGRPISALELGKILKLPYYVSWRLTKKVGHVMGFVPALQAGASCPNVERAIERLVKTNGHGNGNGNGAARKA